MSSGSFDDIKHWVKVYEELVDFKDKLLDEVHEQHTNVTDEGRAELKNDEKLLQNEAARLKRRLAYWKSQLGMRD